MKNSCTTFSKLIPTVAAVLCTASLAWGQSLSTAKTAPNSANGGVDGASCGGTEITQNVNTDTILTPSTVSCNAGGVNTDNFYARNFPIASAINVKCVDFGVETNNLPTNVRVRLYTHPTPGTPLTANLTLLAGGEVQVPIPANTQLQKFTATFAGAGVSVPAGSNLVVELFTPCRQTTCTPPGDGGSIFLGSNSAGQTAPSYIKAGACGVSEFTSMAAIGFPNVHMIIQIGTGGPPPNPCTLPLPACRADVDPPGVGNGIVNVNDLLAVINTWGQTQNPPGTGPRPQGDCDPLPNGNCLVNVNDLLTVINAWGNCPCESRACCFSDGSCQFLCQAACVSAGGSWQGSGSTCGTVNCPVVPINDECGGAIQVFNGPNNINNTGATDGTGIPGGACIFGGAGNIRKDVWYRYTATCTGNLTVDLCATTGAVTDSTLQVYSGACGSLVEVACDDDACTGNTAAGDLSRVTFSATQGVEYRIRVGVWGNTNVPGPMVLTIACVLPNPDNCVDGVALTFGQQVCGNLSAATQDTAPTCNGVGVTKGIWYTVIGNNTTMTATLCGSNQGQFYDARLSVYCGLGCGGLTCVVAANSDTCGLFETVSWCAKQDQKYWILVHTDNVAGQGQYCVVVNSGAVCNNFIVCGVPGDECEAPIDIGSGNTTYAWSTTGATSNPANGNTCDPFGDSATIYGDIWLRWTATNTGSVTLANCGSPFDNKMAMYSNTSCPQSMGNMIGCGDDECGTSAQFNASVTAGQQYLIRIGSWQSAGPTGSGTLTISGASPPPANDSCANAVTVAHTSTTAGTTSGATPVTGPDPQLAGLPFACHWASTPNTIHNTVWYKFVATGTTATVRTCGSSAGIVDTIIGVFSGSCGAFVQIGCGEDECANGAAPYWSNTGQIVGLTVGNTYHIVVGHPGGWGGEVVGAFSLQVGP